MDEVFRKFLRDERRRRGLTQEQLAQKAGVRQGTISKWETDPECEPGVGTFARVMRDGLQLEATVLYQRFVVDRLSPKRAVAGGRPDDALPALAPQSKVFGEVTENLVGEIAELRARVKQLEKAATATHRRQTTGLGHAEAAKSGHRGRGPDRPAPRTTIQRPPRHK